MTRHVRYDTLAIFGAVTIALALGGAIDGHAGPKPGASSAEKLTLVEYGAGTLAVPFKAINAAFEKTHPGVTIQAQFGGSVKMAKQITELHQPADVLAVADYNVIPQQLYARGGREAYANWYVGFASNAITFVYTEQSKGADTEQSKGADTEQSKGADRINAGNWYKILAEPGVEIGRSNPDTDPSGYQTLQMLQLAERYYRAPGLAKAILANAPAKNMRDTETELIGALESGQIDYLAIYRSDAMQHHFKFLQLPPQIDLGNAALAKDYAAISVRTKNGDLPGRPIIYAVTVPLNAPHAEAAAEFVSFLLGPQGQSVLRNNGFVLVNPPLASSPEHVPARIKALVKAWPAQ